MAQILDKQGLQHYANKMCNADNRKVGSKSLPTALNDIDTAIDGFKTLFESEYGSALDMKLENNENIFSIGTGTNMDKRSEVENSFTDIELSGNTVVNLIQEKSYLDWHVLYCGRKSAEGVFIGRGQKYASQAAPNNTTSTDVRCNIISKNNSSYTLIFDATVLEGTSSEFTIVYNGICIRNTAKIKNGRNVLLIQSDESQDGTFQIYGVSGNNNEGDINIRLTNIVILEGDWTNKPIPQYFQGLKSIGEKEDGNHKISISSVGKNLCPITEYNIYNVPTGQNMNGYRDTIIARNIRVKPNTTYAIHVKDIIGAPSNVPLRVMTFRDKIAETGLTHVDCYNNPNKIREYAISRNRFNATITTESDANYINLTTGGFPAESSTITYVDLQIVEGSTVDSIDSYKEDKKEISLSEPLRGLPNGIKDTIEKINGEWKIVRRCSEVVLNGSEDWSKVNYNHNDLCTRIDLTIPTNSGRLDLVCNNIPVCADDNTKKENFYIAGHNNKNRFVIILPNSKLSSATIEGAKEWLSKNNATVVYLLPTPIIEDILPITLQCWKNGTISIDEVLPVETTHTVALNKSAQIQKNIEELTLLRNRIEALEKQYDNSTLNQAYELELLRLDMQLDNII